MSRSLLGIVGRGTAWTSLSMGVTQVAGIIYTVLVLTQLSLYEFGVAELLLTIPPLLSFLNIPGLETTVVSDMGVEKGNGRNQTMRDLFDRYLSLRIPLSVLGWAALFFGAPTIADYYNEAIGTMVQIISFSFLLSPIRALYQIVFRVSLSFSALALMRSIEELSKAAVVAVGLLYFDLGIVAVAIAYIGGELIGLLLLSPWFWSVYQKLFNGTVWSVSVWSAYRLLEQHGKWSVFVTYLSTMGQSLRLWLIKIFVGTQAVALYAVALGLWQHTSNLVPLTKVLRPLIPQFLTEDRSRFFTLINKGIKYQLLGYAAVGLLGVCAFPYLIVWLFPQYESSILLYQLMLLAFIPAGFTKQFEAAFFAAKAQRNLFWATVLKTVLMLVAAPVLMSTFGILGVVYEFLFTRSVFALERYRMMKKIFPDYRLSLRSLYTFDQFDQMIVKKFRKFISI